MVRLSNAHGLVRLALALLITGCGESGQPATYLVRKSHYPQVAETELADVRRDIEVSTAGAIDPRERARRFISALRNRERLTSDPRPPGESDRHGEGLQSLRFESVNEVDSEGEQTSPHLLEDTRFLDNVSPDLIQVRYHVWHGKPVGDELAPDVVGIFNSRGEGLPICSGIVVGDRVVLTAAHCLCLGVDAGISIGPDMRNPMRRLRVIAREQMRQCSESKQSTPDIALLTVGEDLGISARAVAPADVIDTARKVFVVGYGLTESNRYGERRGVHVHVASSSCSGQVSSSDGSTTDDSTYYDCGRGFELVAGRVYDDDHDSCAGDSGGAALVEVHQTMRLAALTSRRIDRVGYRTCGDGGIYVRLDGRAAAWLEAHGIRANAGM